MISKSVSGPISNKPAYEDGFQGTHIKVNLDMTSKITIIVGFGWASNEICLQA